MLHWLFIAVLLQNKFEMIYYNTAKSLCDWVRLEIILMDTALKAGSIIYSWLTEMQVATVDDVQYENSNDF